METVVDLAKGLKNILNTDSSLQQINGIFGTMFGSTVGSGLSWANVKVLSDRYLQSHKSLGVVDNYYLIDNTSGIVYSIEVERCMYHCKIVFDECYRVFIRPSKSTERSQF